MVVPVVVGAPAVLVVNTAPLQFFMSTASEAIHYANFDIRSLFLSIFMQGFIDSNTGEVPFVGAASIGVFIHAKTANQYKAAHGREYCCPIKPCPDPIKCSRGILFLVVTHYAPSLYR